MRLVHAGSLALVSVALLAGSDAAAQPPPPDPATASEPDTTDAATDALARPFGPGTPVEVQCDEGSVYLFVAKGIVDGRAAFPDPFVKVGRIPAKLELPPGVFTVLVEGENVPMGTTTFEVRDQPVRVRVRPGSQGLSDLSTLSIAIGAAAVIAGVLLEVSRTKDEDSSKKRKITIPLFIGGGLGLGGGIGMAFAAKTTLDHDGFVPPEVASVTPQPIRGLLLTGTF